MSDLKPSDLNAEERAIVDEMVTRTGTNWGFATGALDASFMGWMQTVEYQSAYEAALSRILARRALFVPAKEEGHEVGVLTDENATVHNPAPPSEMPEAVHDAWILLDVFGQQDDDDGRAHRRAAVALREWWRSQPAPAAVRMTPELERLLQFAQAKADGTLSRVIHNDALADIAAVRAQAEQAQWVRLPKVRGFFNVVEGHAAYLGFARERKEALAEIDAAEGKVTE